MGAPACISSAVTVGSTTKTDSDGGFSNSSSLVELLAPGSSINSSVPGGGFGLKSGTSMAAPHVAGAWAVLRQVAPTASVATLLGHLQSTGKPITDADNNITKPRIRLLSASTRIADTGMRPGAQFQLLGGGVTSQGVSLATRAGAPSTGTINLNGLPNGAIVQHAALYWMTIGGPDSQALFNGVNRAGTLVGASKDSCWNINQLGPNRVYRHVFPTGMITGNGTFTVGGVGGTGGVDGQGARSWSSTARQPARSHRPGDHPPRRAVLDGATPTMSTRSRPPSRSSRSSRAQRGRRRRPAAVHGGPDDVPGRRSRRPTPTTAPTGRCGTTTGSASRTPVPRGHDLPHEQPWRRQRLPRLGVLGAVVPHLF